VAILLGKTSTVTYERRINTLSAQDRRIQFMHIESVTAAFPTRVLDNDQMIALVRQHSAGTFQGDLEATLSRIHTLLGASGGKTRRWLNDGEKPIDFIESAVLETLRKANLEKSDVDLLIYVGVGKGFLEPGQSYLVAHALGMGHVECFDILDACMSWTRAMHIADGFLQMKRYRHILIVNGEFNTLDGGVVYPGNFCLQNAEQLKYTLPTYTIGSAATATLVSADETNRWAWRFASRADLADLCTIPGFGLGLYSKGDEKIGRNGPFRFTSYGKELHAHARQHAVPLMREIIAECGEPKRIFPHASSFKEWDLFATDVGVQDRMHYVYPEYGNLVSASVPAGLAQAIDQGLVQRGDRLAGWVGSAGMSFAAYSFTY
jgi:acyl-CoA:acyl-CoA alkyltransferase